MDEPEYATVVAALAAVPDPRRRRGRRYARGVLLTLISAAVVSGRRPGRGIGQRVREHAEELGGQLAWPRRRAPSAATLRRALRSVDVAALEPRLGRFAAAVAGPGAARGLRGPALDGGTIRGAGAPGRPVHPVGRARHDGAGRARAEVDAKADELVAAPRLLAGRDWRGTATTVDALRAQRALARPIRAPGGPYPMAGKADQPEAAAATAERFEAPPRLPHERAREYAMRRAVAKGHGRPETRVLEAGPTLNDWPARPDVGRVPRRRGTRVTRETGHVSEEVPRGVTSPRPEQASAAHPEAPRRGHRTIENRVRYGRDVTPGEDAGQARTGSPPRAWAALRDAAISLLRRHGWTNIADALRHDGAGTARALALIGAVPATL